MSFTQPLGMEIATLILGLGALGMLGFVLWLKRYRSSPKSTARAR